MRTFFLENHAPSASKLSITLDQQPEVLYSLFLLYVQVENYQSKYIDTEVLSTFTTYKASLKTKVAWN